MIPQRCGLVAVPRGKSHRNDKMTKRDFKKCDPRLRMREVYENKYLEEWATGVLDKDKAKRAKRRKLYWKKRTN